MGFFNRDDGGQQPGQVQAPPPQPGQAQQAPPPGAPGQAPAQGAPGQAPADMQYQAGSLAGIPESGRQRIERMRESVSRGFFTSDLSVNEFLMVKEAGFDPLGLVLGSSVYHIGFQFQNWNQNFELGVLTQAMYHARDLAMTRMEEEADQLGADGIVGVQLTISSFGEHAEFQAFGTAVKHRGGQLHRAPNGRPFTSDLSGQEFSTLLRSGYRPVGFVMGNCVYHVAHQSMRQAWKQMGQNQEMPNYTQALYEARELAMERMQAEANQVQAQGIVGVRIHEGGHWGQPHVTEFFAVGTAVVPVAVEHEIERPALVLPVTG